MVTLLHFPEPESAANSGAVSRLINKIRETARGVFGRRGPDDAQAAIAAASPPPKGELVGTAEREAKQDITGEREENLEEAEYEHYVLLAREKIVDAKNGKLCIRLDSADELQKWFRGILHEAKENKKDVVVVTPLIYSSDYARFNFPEPHIFVIPHDGDASQCTQWEQTYKKRLEQLCKDFETTSLGRIWLERGTIGRAHLIHSGYFDKNLKRVMHPDAERGTAPLDNVTELTPGRRSSKPDYLRTGTTPKSGPA